MQLQSHAPFLDDHAAGCAISPYIGTGTEPLLAPCYGPGQVLCFQGLSILQINGETLEPPRPLPWYPDKLAWHMNFSREQLRRLPKLNEVVTL